VQKKLCMFSPAWILVIQKINKLLPEVKTQKPGAVVCMHCMYVNENEFSFCTNCGFPLHNKQLIRAFEKRKAQRMNILFKAENSVLVARIVLYVMASFLSLGIFFIFTEGRRKYFVVLLALSVSGLFFFLAFWSQKNPFTALLTAFIVLMAFSAINIFGSLTASFTTIEGVTGMLLCLALLFVVLRGVQGAYRVNLIKEELLLTK
jgi:hypothetical protein